MKLLITMLAIMVCLTGCGPHFNMHAKPDIWVEPAPHVAVDVPVKQIAAPPPAPSGTVTINIPDWPGWIYTTQATDAFVILVVKNPDKFPVPVEMTFTSDKTEPVVMKLVPQPVVEPKK